MSLVHFADLRRAVGLPSPPELVEWLQVPAGRATCDHCPVEHEHATVLSRSGNWAVVHLPGRRFPGIHIQGDTFATLREWLLDTARALRRDPADPETLDDLDGVISEMDAMLGFYEQVLADQGINRPY